eukprot:g12014.t1
MDDGRESTMVPSTDPDAAAEVNPPAGSEASPAAEEAPRDFVEVKRTVAAKPPPAPPTSHCLGARGYDGGFHDIGSFHVFRHEALRQQQLAKDGGADLELFGAAPTGRSALATPLQYELSDGLRVKVAPPLGGAPAVEGKGSEVAGRAFEVLQRQVSFAGQALGGGAGSDPPRTSVDGEQDQEEAAANGNTDADSSSTGNGSGNGGAAAGAAANGKHQYPPRLEEKTQELFALSNTEDNDSIQGLVRSGGYLWIGRFRLPPAQPGEDESEMVDLWPRSVARLSEGRKRAITPLEGNHDAVGPLTAPKESNGGSEALKRARRAHGLLVEALAELRPHIPAPAPQSEGEENPPPTASSPSPKLAGGGGGAVSTGDYDDGQAERAMSVADSEMDTEEEPSAAGGGGRRGRKRPRVEEAAAAAAVGGSESRSYKLRGREADGDGSGGGGGGGGKENNGYSKEEEEEEEDEEGGAGGGKGSPMSAADMTVAAVRGSLLRNRSEDGPPTPEVEEWESVVKNFILHVESLPPGTEQEELSLMFAAALDPTLVRMRAANTSLIKLAEVCASEDADGGGSDGGGGGGKGGGGPGDLSAATKRKNGFNVFLELEAVDGEEAPPPAPAGIDKIRRVVAAAAVAVEAVGRADACVVHAGDTLGGLRELKTDYRRSLPPGPREPIQFIIAEEQARVLGYVSAHESIVARRMEVLRAAGAKVGDAYRAAEQEPGWDGVKGQVGAYLAEFEDYCRSLVSTLKPSSDILGMGVGPVAVGNRGPVVDTPGMDVE